MPTRHAGTEEERRSLDLFIKLNRACASINHEVHGPLREAKLTPIQFGVLDVLYHAGPLPVSVVAEKNLCSQNSLSTVIDTMERNRLVCRDRSVADRRVVQLELTSTGRDLFKSLWPDHLARIVTACSGLGEVEQGQLDRLLRKLGQPTDPV